MRRAPGPTAKGLAVALLLAAAMVATTARPAGAAGPLRLTVAFTGDVSGYLEPCG
ncbi:MAG TPA: hypothetical protein VI078_14250 [bacterium]